MCTIGKTPEDCAVACWRPAELGEARTAHDLGRELLTGLPGDAINIGFEAVDRHVEQGHGDQTALVWLSKTDERKAISYRELAQMSSRFANLLQAHGLTKGARVFVAIGPTARAVCRRPWYAEGRYGLHAPLCRFRSRAHSHKDGDR